MKILIVEDNANMRSFIKKILERHLKNIDKIFECPDGNMSVEIYKRHNPDWVLMDINLGKINGLDLTKTIIEFDPTAKIVILTQYDEPDYRKIASCAGACGYVLKDNMREIIEIIKSSTSIN
ncbi:MAG: response regulator [Calditrichaeota bacterium]|nr:response regulator [Calditrichota bacterium]